jgi:hypothetical protein
LTDVEANELAEAPPILVDPNDNSSHINRSTRQNSLGLCIRLNYIAAFFYHEEVKAIKTL